jgi:diguanylate cyclase (GGDEF)-like protein
MSKKTVDFSFKKAEKAMIKCSILVFGNQDFLTKLPHDIVDATYIDTELIMDCHEAISRIQTAPPDVILVQTSHDGWMKICHWLTNQAELCWVYCILLEDRLQELAARKQLGSQWELEMTACVLRQGVNAYICDILPENRDYSDSYINAHHQLLLAQLMLGVQKAQKFRELLDTNNLLSGMALTDALTEMNNRRALEWELPRHIIKARTNDTPLSLMILDVDFFKQVNDNYGHLVGDRVLQLLSSRLRHNLRSHDTAFRYGGEEFVVLLPQTTNQEALGVAQRLNRIIAQEPFNIDQEIAINITISLGVASLQAHDDIHGVNLLSCADQYLLQAKTSGRNRVVGCSSYILIPNSN